MKRYTDIAPEVLAKMDDKGITDLVDLEIAFAGIEPVLEPPKAETLGIDLKPCAKGYKVGGLVFATEEEARKVIDMATLKEDYEWPSHNYKWLTPCTLTIEVEQYYDQQAVKARVGAIKEQESKKTEHEAAAKAYQAYVGKLADIRNTVFNAVAQAQEFRRVLDTARAKWNRFLELAEGNTAIAEKFFMDAYKNNPEIAKHAVSFKAEILYTGKEPKVAP